MKAQAKAMKDVNSITEILENGERLDSIGFGDIKLIQKPEEFCYGIDAVLLADFAAKGGGRWDDAAKQGTFSYRGNLSAADLGTGTGIIPFILSHKVPALSKIVGLEVQEGSAERAKRSVHLNGLEDKIEILRGDVSNPEIVMTAKDTAGCKGFDIVTTNPPYVEGTRGLSNDNSAKMIARCETTGTLEDFIRTAAALLKERGDFYMVHRPSRLADICCLCRKYRIEPKAMRFVSPRDGEIPNILLFHGVLGGGRELKIRKPLSVYDENGNYTHEVNRIYER